MSAPITINAAPLASMSSSSPSSPGLYVPVHKRTGSNTSLSSSSSSTSSSSDTPFPTTMYSTTTLLSLRPFADESMKGKMRVTCPEVVMTRKMRKALEFHGRTELLSAKRLLPMQQVSPAFVATPTPTLQTAPLRKRSRPIGRAPERRRNPFSSQVLGSRKGLLSTNTGEDDSWRLQVMPVSPVLLRLK